VTVGVGIGEDHSKVVHALDLRQSRLRNSNVQLRFLRDLYILKRSTNRMSLRRDEMKRN
jgi:hypothetical protein